MPLRIHCGKNAAVHENWSHAVNNLRNLFVIFVVCGHGLVTLSLTINETMKHLRVKTSRTASSVQVTRSRYTFMKPNVENMFTLLHHTSSRTCSPCYITRRREHVHPATTSHVVENTFTLLQHHTSSRTCSPCYNITRRREHIYPATTSHVVENTFTLLQHHTSSRTHSPCYNITRRREHIHPPQPTFHF